MPGAQRGGKGKRFCPSGGLLRHHGFPPAIVAAVLARLVGQLHFMTVGTLCQGGLTQMIVGAAPIAPGMGVPSFGIWHDSLFPCCELAQNRRVSDPLITRLVNQGGKGRIVGGFAAAASLQIQVGPASWAQAAAIRPASDLHRHKEVHLLGHHVGHFDPCA
jgi:hypothetical protein